MAARWDFPRNIASTRILTNVGLKHGLTIAQCLEGARLSAEQLDDPERQVEAGQELQVIRNLLKHLGQNLPLAYEAGQQYRPTTFGIWGFAMLSSRTVREAIDVAVKYLRLTCIYCALVTEEGDRESSIIALDDDLPDDVRDFLVERDGMIMMNLQRAVLPIRIPLIAVELKRTRPPYGKIYDDFFGVNLSYGQTQNQIVASSTLADFKLPQGNSSLFKMCEQECQKLLASLTKATDFATRIRDRLVVSTLSMPTMESMAAAFNITARTLRRRLADESTDYDSIVTEVRRNLAEELLRTTNFNVDEIAERLGYSDTSSFIRAFKRWHETTPKQFRASFNTSR